MLFCMTAGWFFILDGMHKPTLSRKKKKHPTKIGNLEYTEARNEPALIHYSGHVKPWQSESDHPFRDEYLNVRAETPFPMEED